MIVTGTYPPACDVPDCGLIRCIDCNERLSCVGPEPAPTCADHPCCVDCFDSLAYGCPECLAVLREMAEDHAADLADERAREERE